MRLLDFPLPPITYWKSYLFLLLLYPLQYGFFAMSWSKSVSALVFDEVLYVGLAVCFFEKLFNKIKGGVLTLSVFFFLWHNRYVSTPDLDNICFRILTLLPETDTISQVALIRLEIYHLELSQWKFKTCLHSVAVRAFLLEGLVKGTLQE